MVDPGNNTNTSGQVNRTMSDAHSSCGSTQNLAAIRAENGILRQNEFEGRTDVLLICLVQHEVGCATRTIPADQHGNLVRQTNCASMPYRPACEAHAAFRASCL